MKNAIRNLVVLTAVTSCTTAFASNVLVWSTGNAGGNPSTVQTYLTNTGLFDSVDIYNQEFWNDPSPDLSGYDAILYYTNASTTDPMQETNGDLLYAFAQAGNRVVLATFSWSSDPFGSTLGGAIVEQGLTPFVLGDGTNMNSSVFMDWNDGSSLFDGVNSVNGSWRNSIALTDGATLHATWSDGTAMVASKGNVVGINALPDTTFGLGGDHAQLFANALTAPIPAPGAVAVLGLGAMMTGRRRRL